MGSLPPTRLTCLEAFFPLRVRSHPARVAPGPVVAALLVFRPSRDPLRPRILKPARSVPARLTAPRRKRLPARLQRAAVRTRRPGQLCARPPNAHPKAHAALPRPNTHFRHAPARAPRRVRSPLPAPTHEAEASQAFTQATLPQPEGRDLASSGSNNPKVVFACALPLEPTPEGLCSSFDPRRRWPPVTRRPPETAASSGSRDRSHVPRRLRPLRASEETRLSFCPAPAHDSKDSSPQNQVRPLSSTETDLSGLVGSVPIPLGTGLHRLSAATPSPLTFNCGCPQLGLRSFGVSEKW